MSLSIPWGLNLSFDVALEWYHEGITGTNLEGLSALLMGTMANILHQLVNEPPTFRIPAC